jgi:hypothetical protein
MDRSAVAARVAEIIRDNAREADDGD